MARRISVVLEEMLEAIDGIQSAIGDKTLDDFSNDWLLKHGVQRGLEIISEAARHLPDSLLTETADLPWSQIRGIGNFLRHEYHKISDAIVWATAVDDLPPLRLAIVGLRQNLDETE